MEPNDMQVGGKHYAGEYQHWDWVTDINLGYLESCATKYILRHKNKNGVQDLEKAHHYMSKVKSLYVESRYRNKSVDLLGATGRFITVNDEIDLTQSRFFVLIAQWKTGGRLDGILQMLEAYIADYREPPMVAATTPAYGGGLPPSAAPAAPTGGAGQYIPQAPAAAASVELSKYARPNCEHCLGWGVVKSLDDSETYLCQCSSGKIVTRTDEVAQPFGYPGDG
jgi:hypothetical protein